MSCPCSTMPPGKAHIDCPEHGKTPVDPGNTADHGNSADDPGRGGDSGSTPGVAAGPTLGLPPGIPGTIPLEKVQDLVQGLLGLPLDRMVRLEVHGNAVEAEFYALDEQGYWYALHPSNKPAVHKITIPVVR